MDNINVTNNKQMINKILSELTTIVLFGFTLAVIILCACAIHDM